MKILYGDTVRVQDTRNYEGEPMVEVEIKALLDPYSVLYLTPKQAIKLAIKLLEAANTH